MGSSVLKQRCGTNAESQKSSKLVFLGLNSIGSRLFLNVLGSALVGLTCLSYFFYVVSENRIKTEIQGTLSTQVEAIDGLLSQTETSMITMSAAIKNMQRLGINDPDAYKQIVFEVFQKRPSLMMAAGFGQTPFAITPDSQWYWPYFYADQGVPGAVGQLLPAPHNSIRYADLAVDDKYPEQDYYKTPVATRKAVWIEPYDWYGITMTSLLNPFFDNTGKMLGVAGADVNVTALGNQVKSSVTSGGGYFIILSEQGKLLAYPPNSEKAKVRASYQEVPALKSIWNQIQADQSGLIQSDGIFWAYQRIPATNWLMIAAVPQSVVLGPVLVGTLTGALGAGVLLALVVALFVHRLNQRLQPILKECSDLATANAMETVTYSISSTTSSDEKQSSFLLRGNIDELDFLAHSFSLMAQRLRESFSTLKTTNEELEVRVEQRTKELNDRNLRLEEALRELQETQAQLVHSEKMSSLGQLVAGVAHEINNPVNFIHGNLTHASQYVQELLELLCLYQAQFERQPLMIQRKAEEIDLEFLAEDFPNLLSSMEIGTSRIKEIVRSLRSFSRLDEAEIKDADIHEGLDSTLMILQNRLKGTSDRLPVQVIKEYGNLPLVECYVGQLNQVFMNILANAIDALEEYQDKLSSAGQAAIIKIVTKQARSGWIEIEIIDNGPGMLEETKKRLFDPFFTTKSVGKGTGLGMSISYQIITENHQGELQCVSTPGEGTKFVIKIPIHLGKQLTNKAENHRKP
ncbi:histidine kinase [Cyanobacteria bacterium FACHB-DQ100]|nr:histidine kinase [Cyanobacteria bacterium FACHB-DQ100]